MLLKKIHSEIRTMIIPVKLNTALKTPPRVPSMSKNDWTLLSICEYLLLSLKNAAIISGAFGSKYAM